MKDLKKMKFKMVYVPVMLLVIIGGAMIGITTFISASFETAIFTRSTFWVNLVTTNVGTICLIMSILLIKSDSYKTTDPNYLLIKKNIDDYYSSGFVAPIFDKFCAEKNKKNKRLCYTQKIRNARSRVKVTPKDLDVYTNGTEEEKKHNKYCIKMNYYDKLLSKEYVDTNIDKINIKFPTVSSSLIFNNVQTNSNNIIDAKVSPAPKVIKDLTPKYLISFSITCLVSAFTIGTIDVDSLELWINTIAKLFTIATQIYFAINYSTKYNEEVNMHNIQFRNNIISTYKVWYSLYAQKFDEKEVSDND